MSGVAHFRDCDFTIAAMSLTVLYAILLAFVLKYGLKLFRDTTISHRVMKTCLLSFLAAVCISRITFFIGWTFDGPQCYPTMIQEDDQWVSYFSNVPATLFVSAFSILVTSFATVFHYHVQAADNNCNIRYHRMIVTFMWLANLGLYFFLLGSLISMFAKSRNLWFQRVLVFYVTTASCVMALLFLFYGIVLYTSVGRVLKTKSLHEAPDYSSIDILADSPSSEVRQSRALPRPDTLQRPNSLLYSESKPRTYVHTPSRGSHVPPPSPSSQALNTSDDGKSLGGSESSPAPTVGLPHVSSYGPSQLRVLTQTTQEARAKLCARKALTVTIPACKTRQTRGRLSDNLRANSIAGLDGYAGLHSDSASALATGPLAAYGSEYGGSGYGATGGLLTTTSNLTSASSGTDGGVDHVNGHDVPLSRMAAMHSDRAPMFPLLGSGFSGAGELGAAGGEHEGLSAGPGSGGMMPIGVNALPWTVRKEPEPSLMQSVSSDHLFSPHVVPAEAEDGNPMENMFHISLISGMCLMCRVGMLLYMNLIATHQGPIVIILYSLLSEIVPVHLILRVFNDAATNYTRDDDKPNRLSPTSSAHPRDGRAFAFGYRPHTEGLLGDGHDLSLDVSVGLDGEERKAHDLDLHGIHGLRSTRERSLSRVSLGSDGYRDGYLPPELDDNVGVCV